MYLVGLIYLVEVTPLVAEVALAADVLILRSEMARATSVAYYLLSGAHLVCRTDARAACAVQDHAVIHLCLFHGKHSFDGLL